MMLSHTHPPVESTHSACAGRAPRSFFQQFMCWMSSAAGDLGTLVAAKSETGEPKVFEIRGQSGEQLWQIYEPRTGSSVYCSSEEEVLQYLDRSEWM